MYIFVYRGIGSWNYGSQPTPNPNLPTEIWGAMKVQSLMPKPKGLRLWSVASV